MKKFLVILLLVALLLLSALLVWPRLHNPSHLATYSATIQLSGTPGAAFSGDCDRDGKRFTLAGILPWTMTESNVTRLEIRKAKMGDELVLQARIGESSFTAPCGPDSKGVRLVSEGGWRFEILR